MTLDSIFVPNRYVSTTSDGTGTDKSNDNQ